MKTEGEKSYVHNGKTIKIIPAKRVKKAEEETSSRTGSRSSEKRTRKAEPEREGSKYVVGDKVAMKPIPIQYSGAGFGESVITKCSSQPTTRCTATRSVRCQATNWRW
jgi:hypothetical protein